MLSRVNDTTRIAFDARHFPEPASLPRRGSEIRAVLRSRLEAGRAVTTVELRGFVVEAVSDQVTAEVVYRHLVAMTRAGEVRRIRSAGRRGVHWVRAESPVVEVPR